MTQWIEARSNVRKPHGISHCRSAEDYAMLPLMKIKLAIRLLRSCRKKFDAIKRAVTIKRPPEPKPTIECFLCKRPMTSYFRKTFVDFGLKDVDYVRCPACGLVVSHTHYQMEPARWEFLNEKVHSSYQGTEVNLDDPNWLSRLGAQAGFLALLAARDLVPTEKPWLDWGAGDGKLSSRCAEFNLKLASYDRFRGNGPGYLEATALKPSDFDLVITTSVFEHIREVGTLDSIAALVSPGGVLATHTEVRKRIPRDPDWFYLLPPHTTFFTHAAMEHLMHRWGFNFSIFYEPGEVWLFFRGDGRRFEAVKQGLVGIPGIHLGSGFVHRNR